MATATITFNLDQVHFESIVDMAGYGVGYWTEGLVIDNTGTDGEYVSYSVTCEDTTYVLTREMVEQAALDLHVKQPLNNYYQDAIMLLVVKSDSSNVGSDIADAIIQQACFGSVIYG
mgnify:CR=1 FL=1